MFGFEGVDLDAEEAAMATDAQATANAEKRAAEQTVL